MTTICVFRCGWLAASPPTNRIRYKTYNALSFRAKRKIFDVLPDNNI
ncbi:MAG: hypothetical protein Q7U47_02265 [Paludibacter sp.]|nr:hypothetical protein [Paludibacter sp.]